ncbi:MAG TPA: hypothetical protein VK657_14025 [Terriglobales bacterium]|nr:hypothetical protein [Terriglobales bacterium]
MRHTIKVIGGGVVLLALGLLLGRSFDGRVGLTIAAMAFVPLWLIAAGVNMWVGVAKAGYSVADEMPTLLVVVAIPVTLAGLVLWLHRDILILLFLWSHD